MDNSNGVSIMPIFALDQEEEKAIEKERARLNRAEAVLTYLGAILWLAVFVVCAGAVGFVGSFIGLMVYEYKTVFVLFIIGYIVGVIAPAMVLTDDLLEWLDLRFTVWWRAYCNKKIDDVKREYKQKKAEAMNTEIDKAFD